MASNNPAQVAANSAAGPPVRMREINSTYHQAPILHDWQGYPYGARQSYQWHIGSLSISSGTFMAHLMNNSGSGKMLNITGVYIEPRVDAALVPAQGSRIDFFRTNSFLINGSLWNYQSQSIDAAGGNVSPFDTTNPSLLTNSTIRGYVLSNSPARTEYLGKIYMTGAASAAQNGGLLAQFQNIFGVVGIDAQRWAFRPNEGLAIQNNLLIGSGHLAITITFEVSSLVV